MRIIDISVPLHTYTPVWPGSPRVRLHWTQRLDAGDECNNSRLECDTHVGTHVDAPLHYLEHGASVEALSLEVLVGRATVAFLPEIKSVTASALDNLALTSTTKRLLLRTRNSELWQTGETEFKRHYVSLTTEAAQWVADQGIRLVGVDYLSVGSVEGGVLTHKILLDAGVVIVEGLNLFDVEPGEYQLICLPLKLVGAEGAPARAVLVRSN